MEKYNKKLNDDFLLKTNLLDITDYKSLELAEAFVFSLRATQIEQGTYKIKSFHLPDFQNLHAHLFQDIYPFAGHFRDVQLMKGSTRFCQFQYINSYASELFYQLNNEPTWTTINQAANRLAYYKSELNMLHPFREGNGRTIRIFVQAYALSKDVNWNFTNTDQETYLKAMIQSVTNTELLERLFLNTIEFI
ncbi:Fic/DOC family protein [Lysinibacillus xylanilyticus]|uniref:Fic/DOC family protein n=1 Tax=Lysinibacillus xylanilyticus TaxID=582475 RepID=UPI003803E92E